MRDLFIDKTRGLAIIWVLFIHSIYWTGTFSSPIVNTLKSLLLIEMPVFFFIIGASSILSPPKKYLPFIGKRLQGIILPYWGYALICIALCTVATFIRTHELNLITVGKYFYTWIIPRDCQMSSLPFLKWALWFIPVYIVTLLFIPVMIKYKKQYIIISSLCLGIFAIMHVYKIFFIRSVSFYLLWIFAGIYYPEIKNFLQSNKSIRTLSLLFFGGICIAVLLRILLNVPINMQANKFPPNLMFLAYSVTIISFIVLAGKIFSCLKSHNYLHINSLISKKLGGCSFVKKLACIQPLGNIMIFFGRNCLIVFLFHPLAFLLAYYVLKMASTSPFGNILRGSILISLYYFIFSFSSSYVFVFLFGWLQKIRIINFK